MISDVYVVGGGPAGIAAALAARRNGLSVTVADGQSQPIDKACGEGLMPDSLEAASALGIDLSGVPCYPFRGIRFHGGDAAVAAEFPAGRGIGVRRTALHEVLVRTAEEAGVRFEWNTPVAGLDSIKSRWIVGADGVASRVRTWAKLEATHRNSLRYGFRRHYRTAPWTDYVEIYWGDRCQIYITPVATDQVCVALITSDSKQRVGDALVQFPILAARLANAPDSSTERGAVTATRKLRRVTNGNVALIGDASGSVDAITGEGLCLIFRQVRKLADAMSHDNLEEYEASHPRMAARPRFMADFMLTMDRWPSIRRRALPAMAAHPELFGGLLAMHVGAASPPRFAADCVALGWRMLSI